MKTPEEQLLHDVLVDGDYAAFRQKLYFQIAPEIRRRRSERRWGQLQALAACAVIAIGLLLLDGSRTRPSRVTSGRCDIVRSIPLRAEQVVVANGFGVDVISTRPMHLGHDQELFALEVVRTGSASGALEYISDGQLLEIFAGRPMALVSADQGGKRLCFLDPTARLQFVEESSGDSL